MGFATRKYSVLWSLMGLGCVFLCRPSLGADVLEKAGAVLGKASLSAPQGSLPADTKVFFTKSAEVEEDFKATLGQRASGIKMLPENMRISIPRVRPSSPLKLSIQLPPGISKPTLLAQVFYDGETEAYDYWEDVPSSFDPKTRQLTAQIPPKLFNGPDKKTEAYEATLVVTFSGK